MRRKFLLVVGLLFTALLCVAPLTAQLKQPVSSQTAVPQNAASTATATADPLGRETPRGTVLAFIRAAQNKNYSEAIQYFQPNRSRRRNSQEDDQELANQLRTIFNQKCGGLLDTISPDPLGHLNDGLPADEEKIGGSPALSESFPIYLIRVEDEHDRKIWLFPRKTLNQVPSVYDSLRFPQLEKQLPQSLVSNRFLSMPLWQWIAIPLFLPLALFIAQLLSLATHAVRQWIRRRNGKEALEKERFWQFGSATLLLAAILHYEFVYLIGTSILHHQIIFIFLAICFLLGDHAPCAGDGSTDRHLPGKPRDGGGALHRFVGPPLFGSHHFSRYQY